MQTIKLNSKKLLTALNMCKGAISNRPIVPACGYFHLHGKKSIIIEACNMEVSIQTTLDAELSDPIDLLLPGDKILSILAKLADQPITMNISDDFQIKLTYSTGSCEFAGDNGKDFPKIATEKGDKCTIQSDDLQAAIYTTAYARGSAEDALVFISGLNIELSDKGADFAASNRHVLAKSHIDGTFAPARILLPVTIVNILSAMKLIGDLNIEISENSISFATSDIQIKSRLMGEKFPAWQNFIPECDIITTVNRIELLGAVKRVMDFANKTTNKAMLVCGGSELTITTSDTDFKQQARETINAEPADFEIGINGNLLAEVLSHINSETVLLKFRDYKSALIVQDPDNLEDLSLVMAVV